jgi:hypothetical protein
VLGNAVSKALLPFGFPLYAWSRTRKASAGVVSYAGIAELDEFLAKSRVLVCLLPARRTRRRCSIALRSGAAAGAHVVNVARGGIVVEEDLIALLDRRTPRRRDARRVSRRTAAAAASVLASSAHRADAARVRGHAVGDSIAQVAAKIRVSSAGSR